MKHIRISELARVSYCNNALDKQARNNEVIAKNTCIKCGSPLDSRNKCPKCGKIYIFEDLLAKEIRKI